MSEENNNIQIKEKKEINTDLHDIDNEEIKEDENLNIEDGDEYIGVESKEYYNIGEGGEEGEYNGEEIGEGEIDNYEQPKEEENMEEIVNETKNKNEDNNLNQEEKKK